MARDGQTVVYVEPELREPLNHEVRRWGVKNRVLNAAIWMFVNATAAEKDTALQNVRLVPRGRKKQPAKMGRGEVQDVLRDLKPIEPKIRRRKTGGS